MSSCEGPKSVPFAEVEKDPKMPDVSETHRFLGEVVLRRQTFEAAVENDVRNDGYKTDDGIGVSPMDVADESLLP